MPKVKVCGITCPEDAQMAVQLGADALGFIFAPSPRQIRPDEAREITRTVPPFVKTVGVFVNESPAFVREIMAFCGLDLIQFHGEESPEVCKEFMPRAIKAFRVRDGSVLPLIRPFQGRIRAALLDTFSHESRGGTGQIFDWDIAVTAKGMRIPVILSGGLNPSNIREAIFKVGPFAVDVNSGIEKRPGKKDPELMAEFMERIKAADSGRARNE